MEGTHKAGLMATNSYAQHVKNLNVTNPKNEYAFKNTNKCDSKIILDISLACAE